MGNVYCDECGKYTSVLPLKEKKHPRDIHELYFKCDHCYWHYTVDVTNRRARRLQRIMKRKEEQARRNGANIKALTYGYKRKEYTVYDPETKGDVLIKKCKEQIELDEIMDMLKFNMINYGVADLHER